jgi:predicted SnoaL-like aldol condensation-catalyzing enzyme
MHVMFTRTRLAVILVAGAAGTCGCASPRLLLDAEVARTNTHTVLAFQETVYNKHHVREGFERYVGPGFRQHDSTLPEDRDAAIAALNELLANVFPGARIVVERTVAQGDLVASQLRWQPGDGHGMERVEIYRLENGRIVECWAVAQPLVGQPAGDGSASGGSW